MEVEGRHNPRKNQWLSWKVSGARLRSREIRTLYFDAFSSSAPYPSVLDQKTDASAPDNTFIPPVPPVPTNFSSSPTHSPLADVFSRYPDNNSKPLPPIMLSPVPKDEDDSSIVFVNKPSRSPSPAGTSKSAKRRSVSVGDTDLKAIMSSSSVANKLPYVADERVERSPEPPRRRLLSDLAGELSSFDPERSPTLDLRDPSTPGRRSAYQRSQPASPKSDNPERPELRPFSSSPTQTSPGKLSLRHSTNAAELPRSSSPIIPSRSASLTSSPVRPGGRPASSASLGNSTVRPRGARLSVQGPRDPIGNRLRVTHRSAASNSEPSLIPSGDDGIASTYMFPFEKFHPKTPQLHLIPVTQALSRIFRQHPVRTSPHFLHRQRNHSPNLRMNRLIWTPKEKSTRRSASTRMKTFLQKRRLQNGLGDSAFSLMHSIGRPLKTF